jgi:hypothetical protein
MARPKKTPTISVVPKVLWRFADLKAAGVCANHDMLKLLIQEHAFPPGVWLSANTHAWVASEVMAWVAARPKVKPPRQPKEDAAPALPFGERSGGPGADMAGAADAPAQPHQGRRRMPRQQPPAPAMLVVVEE